MARLFGREWSRRQLLERVGDISQLGGTRRVRLVEGTEDGVNAIEFRTGSGFAFTILPTRGLDISFAEYRGAPLCWRSPTGEVHPAYFEPPEAMTWLRGFYGGLLATCGLVQAGAASVDQDESLGLHGRINYVPARNVYHDGAWDGDEYIMWAYGRMRETRVYGENVRLTRRIWARLGESRLYIHDLVENLGHSPVPHMIAYHINPGFPVIDHDAKMVSTSVDVRPRDEAGERTKQFHQSFHVPVAKYREQVFYHEMKADPDGYAYCATVNRSFHGGGLGVYVRYMPGQLPYFWQWKMLGEGTYVVGMEPANCLPEGRDKERARDALRFLEPGESQEYNLEIGVLTSTDEIAEYEARVRSIVRPPKPKLPPEEVKPEPAASEPGVPETTVSAAASEQSATAMDEPTPEGQAAAPAESTSEGREEALAESVTDGQAPPDASSAPEEPTGIIPDATTAAIGADRPADATVANPMPETTGESESTEQPRDLEDR